MLQKSILSILTMLLTIIGSNPESPLHYNHCVTDADQQTKAGTLNTQSSDQSVMVEATIGGETFLDASFSKLKFEKRPMQVNFAKSGIAINLIGKDYEIIANIYGGEEYVYDHKPIASPTYMHHRKRMWNDYGFEVKIGKGKIANDILSETMISLVEGKLTITKLSPDEIIFSFEGQGIQRSGEEGMRELNVFHWNDSGNPPSSPMSGTIKLKNYTPVYDEVTSEEVFK